MKGDDVTNERFLKHMEESSVPFVKKMTLRYCRWITLMVVVWLICGKLDQRVVKVYMLI